MPSKLAWVQQVWVWIFCYHYISLSIAPSSTCVPSMLMTPSFGPVMIRYLSSLSPPLINGQHQNCPSVWVTNNSSSMWSISFASKFAMARTRLSTSDFVYRKGVFESAGWCILLAELLHGRAYHFVTWLRMNSADTDIRDKIFRHFTQWETNNW